MKKFVSLDFYNKIIFKSHQPIFPVEIWTNLELWKSLFNYKKTQMFADVKLNIQRKIVYVSIQ